MSESSWIKDLPAGLFSSAAVHFPHAIVLTFLVPALHPAFRFRHMNWNMKLGYMFSETLLPSQLPSFTKRVSAPA